MGTDDLKELGNQKVSPMKAIAIISLGSAALCGLLGFMDGSPALYATFGAIGGPIVLGAVGIPRAIIKFRKERALKQQLERDRRIAEWNRTHQPTKEIPVFSNSPAPTPTHSPQKQNENEGFGSGKNPSYDIWAAGGRFFGRREDN